MAEGVARIPEKLTMEAAAAGPDPVAEAHEAARRYEEALEENGMKTGAGKSDYKVSADFMAYASCSEEYLAAVEENIRQKWSAAKNKDLIDLVNSGDLLYVGFIFCEASGHIHTQWRKWAEPLARKAGRLLDRLIQYFSSWVVGDSVESRESRRRILGFAYEVKNEMATFRMQNRVLGPDSPPSSNASDNESAFGGASAGSGDEKDSSDGDSNDSDEDVIYRVKCPIMIPINLEAADESDDEASLFPDSD